MDEDEEKEDGRSGEASDYQRALTKNDGEGEDEDEGDDDDDDEDEEDEEDEEEGPAAAMGSNCQGGAAVGSAGGSDRQGGAALVSGVKARHVLGRLSFFR